MARIASFPTRSTLRYFAQSAYRLAMHRGKFESTMKIEGIDRKVTVDTELNCVFFDWTDSTYGTKSTSMTIAKSWL
jgi:hypothetical protein